jgi:hypothetical protein
MIQSYSEALKDGGALTLPKLIDLEFHNYE